MKKLLILTMLLLSSIYVLSETKQVGKNSYVSYGQSLNFAIDLIVVNQDFKKRFLPIRFCAATKKGQHINLDRNSFILTYKGKEYKMPTYKYVKKHYKNNVLARNQFNLAKSTLKVFTSKKCTYKYLNLFPTRDKRLVENYAYLNYYSGISGYLIFENPGIKKGETITFKVFDKKERKVINSLTLTL